MRVASFFANSNVSLPASLVGPCFFISPDTPRTSSLLVASGLDSARLFAPTLHHPMFRTHLSHNWCSSRRLARLSRSQLWLAFPATIVGLPPVDRVTTVFIVGCGSEDRVGVEKWVVGSMSEWNPLLSTVVWAIQPLHRGGHPCTVDVLPGHRSVS